MRLSSVRGGRVIFRGEFQTREGANKCHCEIRVVTLARAPATMPASVRPGWGVLVAVGDKAKAAEHFDRSLDRKADVSAAALTCGDLDLCTTKTVVGRLLMNAEGSARAASQVADILIDVPSGA